MLESAPVGYALGGGAMAVYLNSLSLLSIREDERCCEELRKGNQKYLAEQWRRRRKRDLTTMVDGRTVDFNAGLHSPLVPRTIRSTREWMLLLPSLTPRTKTLGEKMTALPYPLLQIHPCEQRFSESVSRSSCSGCQSLAWAATGSGQPIGTGTGLAPRP